MVPTSRGEKELYLGVWAHPGDFSDESAVDKLLNKLSEIGANKLVVNVKDSSGRVYFKSNVGIMAEVIKHFDFLRYTTERAGEFGIEVHAWFVVFPEGIKELKGFLERHPGYACIEEGGKRIGWMCPSHEEVHDYLLTLFREVIENYNIDGIHLDYIRYPEPIVYKACFCNNCGLGGYMDEKWILHGSEYIKSFVEKSYKLTREYGIEHSAAVFPDYPTCIITVRQDWVEWINRGLLDWVAPMTYTNITKIVEEFTKIHSSLVLDRALLLEGLGKRSSKSRLSPGDLLNQIHKALLNGADGVMIFSYSGMEDQDFRAISRFMRSLRGIQ
ncbi:MAG: hypothetical protein DRJ49_00335 [Thermoprotei archaeon]|nr:MAG: hypothetical protein DRN53_01510 [Thermoprotei archaeon]RLE90260.1 MAG: hypothetical protein DRJ49_00335 [Thermoprotei archaeon]